MKQLKYVIFVVAVLAVVAPQMVLAEPIEVLNPSFEYIGGEDIDVKTMGTSPDNWTGADGVEGAQTSGIEGEPIEDGVCAAVYTFQTTEGSVYQLTDYTIGAGDEYTLIFDAFYLWASSPPTWECTYRGRLYYEDPCDSENRIVIDSVENTHTTMYAWILDNTLNTTVPLGHAAVGNKLGIELAATEVDGSTWLGFDTVRLDVQTAVKATAVNPPDKAENVNPGVDLQWAAPLLYTPIYYDVYRSSTDPNANLPGDMVLNHANQLTYDDPCDLDYEAEYYWRVVSYETYDVNYPGAPWSFTTWPATPIFTTDASDALVDEGDSAVFSVISPNATLGFQWYKGAAVPVNDGDDGGDVSVVSDATSSTLTIANVNQAADEGFYYCVATNSNGNAESNHAKLEVKDLLAHWTLDSAKFVANQYVDETGNHNADPNKPSEVSFTDGIIGGALGAVEMDVFRWARAGNWRPNAYSNGQMTVSAWVKVPDANDILYPQGIVSKKAADDSMEWTLELTNEKGVGFESWNGGAVWSDIDIFGEDWVYVVATVDGAGVGRVYINGGLQGVDDTWVYGTNVDAEILIGKGNPDDYVFPGMIDDVKIYNYARDPYVIAADYTNVAGGSVCVEDIAADLNGDCKVDLADVAEFWLVWSQCNLIPTSACQ